MYSQKLMKHADMLNENFNIRISEDEKLICMPIIIEALKPYT